MKKMILMLAAMMVCSVAVSQSPTQIQLVAQDNDYIEVNARAMREVAPDEIFVGIVLDQNDTKGKYTIDQLETQLNKALKGVGIDVEKDLRVSDMSSDYKTFLLKKNEGRTTKSYVLKVNNEQLMPVFRALDAMNISNVNVQSARYSKSKELYNELIGEATAQAKARADIMAGAVGQTIKQMIYAQTYDNSSVYDAGMATNAMPMMKMARAEAYSDASMPALEFTKIRIEANVTARFRLWIK